MKESLLNLIYCPKCSSSGFILLKKEKNRIEIRAGDITCKRCSYRIPIVNGVVNCIHNPPKTVKNEIKENLAVAEKRRDKDEEWILALPLAENFGNEKCMDINKGYLENVIFLMSKVSLKGKALLDIGAGTCWTTNIFAGAGANAVATDISPEKFVGLSSSDAFIRKNKVYFERVLCSMDSLPFNDSSFDVVVSNAAVHHALDVKKTFSEISRVLREGGLYVQTNEPVCSIFNFNRRIDIKKAKERGMDVAEGWNENTYRYLDYRKFMKNNGLSGEFFFPPSFNHILENKAALRGVKGFKRLIGALISYVWGINSFRYVLVWFFPVSLILFGGSFVLIARKHCNKI